MFLFCILLCRVDVVFMYLNLIRRMSTVSYNIFLKVEIRKLVNWFFISIVFRRVRFLVVVCLEYKSRGYFKKKRSDMFIDVNCN